MFVAAFPCRQHMQTSKHIEEGDWQFTYPNQHVSLEVLSTYRTGKVQSRVFVML